jgi:hypothetical protein
MTVVSDAYIDCDVNAEKKAFPDVMLRIQLARKIAFYYYGGDQEKALGDINDILEKVVDGYERVSTIDALLAITLRIRPVDYKTFDEWRRTIELLATSA